MFFFTNFDKVQKPLLTVGKLAQSFFREEWSRVKMTGNEYQKLAMRTNDGKNNDRMNQTAEELVICQDEIDFGGIINGCFGLAGESGEFIDAVKKWIFHNKPFDKEHLKKEIGDVCWYVAMICHSFGWDLDEILQMNVDKLKARYPKGFSTDRSNNRSANDV